MKNTGQSTSSSGEKIGSMSREEFDQINQTGAETVAAITPTSDPLSAGDEKLMLLVADGGMMQLEVSRIAVNNASDEDVLLMAEAEVEEQTGLSEKLQEIADAKGLTLPSAPSAETEALIERLEDLEDDEFDLEYMQQSGVAGHEQLDEVMSRVKSEAVDPALKALAAAAHPLVQTHLQLSREIVENL